MELSFFNNSRSVEMVQSFLQKGALHDMSYLQVKGLSCSSCTSPLCGTSNSKAGAAVAAPTCKRGLRASWRGIPTQAMSLAVSGSARALYPDTDIHMRCACSLSFCIMMNADRAGLPAGCL